MPVRRKAPPEMQGITASAGEKLQEVLAEADGLAHLRIRFVATPAGASFIIDRERPGDCVFSHKKCPVLVVASSLWSVCKGLTLDYSEGRFRLV